MLRGWKLKSGAASDNLCDLLEHRQGSVAALKGSISGDSFDLPLPDVLLHPLERLAPSGPWVFPHPDVWRDKARPRSYCRG